MAYHIVINEAPLVVVLISPSYHINQHRLSVPISCRFFLWDGSLWLPCKYTQINSNVPYSIRLTDIFVWFQCRKNITWRLALWCSIKFLQFCELFDHMQSREKTNDTWHNIKSFSDVLDAAAQPQTYLEQQAWPTTDLQSRQHNTNTNILLRSL